MPMRHLLSYAFFVVICTLKAIPLLMYQNIQQCSKNFKQMTNLNSLSFLFFLLTLLITLQRSEAKQKQPILELIKINQFYNTSQIYQSWHGQSQLFLALKLSVSTSSVLAGILCFLAASISSAGGIGGGGLFIPILSIVGGLDLKTASSFSAFMVTGGSIANVACNLYLKSSKYGGKPLIDHDITLLSEPCILLGVSVGVICNLMFPEWLVTILFVFFLAWCTFKTCKSGMFYWKLESGLLVKKDGCGQLEKGLLKDEISDKNEENKRFKEPLLSVGENCGLGIPWMKLGTLVLIWFCFFVIYYLRGNRYEQGIAFIEPCGVGYWILSATQIPLAIVFTLWILYKRESIDEASNNQDTGRDIPKNRCIFPLMALLAGVLGGVFGIGGGMLISPLLLQAGITPEVTAATCSFMVFFSSSMSAIQYLLLGMEHIYTASIFAVICFVASLVGLMVVQRAIEKHGRASLIVFSVGTVMALSTVLITSFGTLGVWRDYATGKYMGFKKPC